MSTPAYNTPIGLPMRAPKTWFGRNWKWFVPVMVMAWALIFGLFIFGLFELVTSAVRTSEPYRTAIRKAQESPLVAQKIGRPFKLGWLTSGSVNWSAGGSGTADLSIPISGPRGRGRILVSAKRENGSWAYQTLEVDVDGDDVAIPLADPGLAPPGSSDDFVWRVRPSQRAGG